MIEAIKRMKQHQAVRFALSRQVEVYTWATRVGDQYEVTKYDVTGAWLVAAPENSGIAHVNLEQWSKETEAYTDEIHLDTVDLGCPALGVTMPGGYNVVIDGSHRMMKAFKDGRKTYDCVVLDAETTESIVISREMVSELKLWEDES